MSFIRAVCDCLCHLATRIPHKSATQRQTAVTAYLKRKQLLLFVFACQKSSTTHKAVNNEVHVLVTVSRGNQEFITPRVYKL